MKRVLKNGRFWAIAVWFFFNCGIFFGIGGLWGGPYLMHVYGLSKAGAGNVLNMVALGLIIGSPVLSMLSDRILTSRKKVMIISSIAVVLTMLALAVFTDRLTLSILYAAFFCIGRDLKRETRGSPDPSVSGPPRTRAPGNEPKKT